MTKTPASATSPSAELLAILADFEEWTAAHTTWRGAETLNLNAATNTLSPRARAALAGSLADKGISSGLHSRHHFGGRFIDRIEEEVERLARDLFGAGAADLRPMSGSLANAVVLAAADPKRPIITGDATTLGHLSFSASGWGGRLTAGVLALPFADDGVTVDLPALEQLALRHEPSLIVLGSQAMLFPLDVAGVRAIAGKAGALVVYDAAHPLGVIAGGRFQEPIGEGADILTASTQKSLPGPVGGIVLTRTPELMEPIYTLSNALMSNYQNNRVLSLGHTLLEAAAFGRPYADACVDNARTLAAALAEQGLAPLFADRGFTDSNQLLLAWGDKPAADAFARRCEQANIIVSTIRLPSGTPGPVRFGSRIGVQDITRCGVDPSQLPDIAAMLAEIAHGAPLGPVTRRATETARGLRTPRYCFDTP
jgi:glycine hydroxymethyltransferase